MLREIKSGLIQIRHGKFKTLPEKVARYSLRRFPKIKNRLSKIQMNRDIEKAFRINGDKKAIFENVSIIYILNEADPNLLSKSIIRLKQQITSPDIIFLDLSNNAEEVGSIIQNYLPKSPKIIVSPNERPDDILQKLYDSNLTRDYVILINEYAKFNKLSNLLDTFEFNPEKNYLVDFVRRNHNSQKSYYIRQNSVNFYENLNSFRGYFLLLNKEKLNNINLKNLFRSDFYVTPGILSADIFEKDFDERNIFFNLFDRSYEIVEIDKSKRSRDYTFGFAKKVSIIILTRDKIDLLDDCLKSIEESTYKNYEVIIIDHESNAQSKEYLKNLKHKVVPYEGEYNFSHMNNIAASHATGEVLCFLNNDTKVISKNWLEILGGFAIQEDIGAVGAKLLFQNKAIQHAGITINSRFDSASHILTYEKDNSISRELNLISSPKAVTGACLFVEAKKFFEVGGFSEMYKTTWQDLDFCLTLSSAGYRTIMIPYVKLFHFESKTRKAHPSKTEKRDLELFQRKWRS